MIYEFCRDFESFYEVMKKSYYKPPKEVVGKGFFYVLKKNNIPISCSRLMPYVDKFGNIIFYFLGNVYTIDQERNSNYGFQVCRFMLQECKKEFGDIIIVGTVSSKTKEGQILERYYRKLGGISATTNFIKYVEENTGYILEEDLKMMLVRVMDTPF